MNEENYTFFVFESLKDLLLKFYFFESSNLNENLFFSSGKNKKNRILKISCNIHKIFDVSSNKDLKSLRILKKDFSLLLREELLEKKIIPKMKENVYFSGMGITFENNNEYLASVYPRLRGIRKGPAENLLDSSLILEFQQKKIILKIDKTQLLLEKKPKKF